MEDNPGDAYLIREAFKECGHQCDLTFADSFAQAVELLPQSSFELIVSDMGAHTQCSTLIRAVRSNPHLQHVPVIILSGSQDVRSAYQAGANAFLLKTMDMDSFFDKIRALMHFWIDVAELP